MHSGAFLPKIQVLLRELFCKKIVVEEIVMITKEFLDFTVVRDNGFALARKIFDSGYVPSIVYTSMRGGAYLGNVISEMFKVLLKDGKILYSTVVAHSYSGVRASDKIVLDGWTYPPEQLEKSSQVLLVDDIFDSGETLNFLVQDLMMRGVERERIKVAVHDYKRRHNAEKKPVITPDWWARLHEIYTEEDDVWIHYTSHELVGLSQEELKVHYFDKNPMLKEVFKGVQC